MVDEFYLRKARKLIPKGFYQLPPATELRPSDLVYDWTSDKFHRADWEGWLKSPLIDSESMICAIRKARFEGFETEQKRIFTLRS